jgi:hypothetical protein
LYDDDGNQLGSSALSGSATETITYTWSGMIAFDDSRYFRIAVRPFGGAHSCTPYTLFADVWQQ